MAGTDTTSITTTYLFWELSRRPDIMKKLQAELDEAISDSKVLPDINILQQLPYLGAFLKEGERYEPHPVAHCFDSFKSIGLRVYGAAPSLLERVVPASTSKNGPSDEIFDLMGYALPPGTIVATQAWSMHRDPSVFPSPETFLPERWLNGNGTSEEDLATMSAYMMPFGTGSRICGGQNLAQMMIKVVLAAFVKSFDIAAPAETNERSMEIKDSFVRIISFFCWCRANYYCLGDFPRRHGVQAHVCPSSTLISIFRCLVYSIRELPPSFDGRQFFSSPVFS